MCKYCENYGKKAKELKVGDIFVIRLPQYSIVGENHNYIMPMNFCPNCGRRVKDES